MNKCNIVSSEKKTEVVGDYAIYRRNNQFCILNRFSLRKEYLSAEEFRKKKEKVLTSSPCGYSQKIVHPNVNVYHVVASDFCNLSCTYCCYYAYDNNRPKLRMSLECARNITSHFNNECPNGLLLITGGEPLTNWRVVRYIFQNIKGTKVLYTNGTLLTRKIVEILAKNNVNPIVSLDGISELANTNRYFTNGRKALQKIFQGINILRKVGLDFGVSMVVGPHNIKTLTVEVERIVEEYAPISIGLNLPHYSGSSDYDVSPEEYAEKLIHIFYYSKKKGIFIDQLARRIKPLVFEQFRLYDCDAFGSKRVFLSDGTQTNCQNMARYLDPEKILPVDSWIRRIPVFSDYCENCEAIGICGGGCGFDGHMRYGPNRFDKRNCFIVKRFQELLVWDIWDIIGKQKPSFSDLYSVYGTMIERKKGLSVCVGHLSS